MTSSIRCHGAARRVICLVFASAVLAPLHARAADVPCAVGTQVQGEFGGGEVGTIAEIGSAAPYIGWYRITFRWSPKGEWLNAGTWKVQPEGSDDRCIIATAGTPTKGSSAVPAVAPSTAARGLPSTDNCRSGSAVVDRQQRHGTVLGESNGMCKVQLADGEVRSYLAWMLSAPGAAAAGGASGLTPGSYTCTTDGAGLFRVQIRDASSYVSSSGTSGNYSIDAATSMIHFSSGSLSGYHSKLFGPGKFGLSEDSTTMFYTVCNLK